MAVEKALVWATRVVAAGSVEMGVNEIENTPIHTLCESQHIDSDPAAQRWPYMADGVGDAVDSRINPFPIPRIFFRRAGAREGGIFPTERSRFKRYCIFPHCRSACVSVL